MDFYKKIIKEKDTPEILFNLLEKKLNTHQKIVYNHLENFTYIKKKCLTKIINSLFMTLKNYF